MSEVARKEKNRDYLVRRQQVGDLYVAGNGIEIGAGASPCQYKKMSSVTLIDKRSKPELEALFGVPIDYAVESVDHLDGQLKFDFLIAHHVLEHSPNSIKTLAEWQLGLEPGGIGYITVPSNNADSENMRPLTPIDHHLDDFFFDRDGTHFESRQHIYSFIHNWAKARPESFWYAQEDVQKYIKLCLSEALRDGHDLHWHVYSLETVQQIVLAAACLSGFGAEILHLEEVGDSVLIVWRKSDRTTELPGFLSAYRATLSAALERLDKSIGPVQD